MKGNKGFGARLFVVLILLASSAFAQGAQGNGTLTGTVVDNVGVVPGATVTATQVDTNVSRTTATNQHGEFRMPSLPPGRYTVKVEMDGFKPVNMPAFNLLGNEIRALGRLACGISGETRFPMPRHPLRLPCGSFDGTQVSDAGSPVDRGFVWKTPVAFLRSPRSGCRVSPVLVGNQEYLADV